jgi:hypothetical protein
MRDATAPEPGLKMPRNPLPPLGSLLVLAALAPGPARTQTVPSPYRFVDTRQAAGIFFGYMSPGTGRFGYGPGPGPSLGARYDLHLRGPLALEGVARLLPTTRDLVDPGRYPDNPVVGKVDANIVTIDARLRFSLTGGRTWNGLDPYGFAGGGAAFDLAGNDPAESALLPEDRFRFRTTILGLAGGGIRWLPSRRWVVRTDFSFSFWRLTTPAGYRSAERGFSAVARREWISAPSISLGLGLRF